MAEIPILAENPYVVNLFACKKYLKSAKNSDISKTSRQYAGQIGRKSSFFSKPTDRSNIGEIAIFGALAHITCQKAPNWPKNAFFRQIVFLTCRKIPLKSRFLQSHSLRGIRARSLYKVGVFFDPLVEIG